MLLPEKGKHMKNNPFYVKGETFMKKILITGAMGQIGTAITKHLRDNYGTDNVIASGLHMRPNSTVCTDGIFEIVDVTTPDQLAKIAAKHKVDTVIHLAAILSAIGEEKPQLLWNINMNGLYNVLELARDLKLTVFTPSSIAAFGKNTPPDNTPQDTIQRPSTIYGVSKVAGELLCDYYFTRYGVDTRGVRYPGLISNEALPGGGTTDYAVHIFYEALKNGHFTSNIAAGTFMDMMYMPDALNAIVTLLEADPERLIHRNAFNVTAMSFDPEILKQAIQREIPNFTMDYSVDAVKQKIAESWPNSIDDSAARKEWGWSPTYDLDAMVKDMIAKLRLKMK